MKEGIYTKSFAKNQVYAEVHMQDIRKNVLLKFIKLCMETPRLCPFQGHKYGRRKPTETSVFELFYFKCVNSSLEELITIKTIFILRQGMFREQNLKKSVMFLTHTRAIRATMPRHAKAWNSSVLYRKTKNPFEPKICSYKVQF